MTSRPLISIIIPVYNVGEYLIRCLDSIVGQTYRNIEVIIVDDGSSDNSGEIADSYAERDDRVDVIHKKNGGVSSARNAGMNVAKGDYIMFVDADDRIDLSTCERCVGVIKNDEDFISFSVSRVNKKERGKVKEGRSDGSFEYFSDNKQIIKNYLKGSDLRAVAHLFNRKTLGSLRFNEAMRIHEDALFAFQFLTKSQRAVVINMPLYFYISRPGSAMKKFQKSDTADIRRHYDEVTTHIINTYPELETDVRRRTMGTLFNLLTAAKQTRNKLEINKSRKDIRDNQNLMGDAYSMTPAHKMKLILSYCPLPVFNLGLLLFRKIRRVA